VLAAVALLQAHPGQAGVEQLFATIDPGLWETRSTGGVFSFDASGKPTQRTRTHRTCVTEAGRAEAGAKFRQAVPEGDCAILTDRVEGERFELEYRCAAEGGAMTMRLSGSVGRKSYRSELVVEMGGLSDPAQAALGTMREVSEARWLRPCQPGDPSE
jgi:hypothetical protein